MTDPRPWTEAEFADLLARPETHVSADANALALGRTVADEAELLTLATLPDARRRGHARRRLAAFEAEAVARGATVAFLEVAADNLPALALYLAAGYAEAGRRRGYYRRVQAPAADALVMRKPLDGAHGSLQQAPPDGPNSH
jgi:ribosomal-protein-alanine N-acetyltransferase